MLINIYNKTQIYDYVADQNLIISYARIKKEFLDIKKNNGI